jgi:hypothetical protein
MILELVIVAIVILTVLLCRALKAKYASPVESYSSTGWVKYGGYDSPYGNIVQFPHYAGNVAWLADKCDSMPGCKAFNTMGWLKNRVPLNRRNWKRVSDNQALYIRR